MQISVPIITTTQDQREANLAAQLGLDVDIVEEEEEVEEVVGRIKHPLGKIGSVKG
jgi:hypothetical protein